MSKALKSTDRSIQLEIQNMNQSKEDTLSCENEMGDQKTFEARMLIPAEVSTQSLSSIMLAEGDTYTAQCNATGGTPMVNIKWQTATGIALQGNITKENRTLISKVNYKIDKAMNGQSVRCLVEQYGKTLQFPVDVLAVYFAPDNIVYQPTEMLTEDDRISAQCSADGNPKPSITYEMKTSNGGFKPFDPETTGVTLNMNGARIRCRADNAVNSTLSIESTLTVTKKPTRVYITTKKIETTRSTTTASDTSGNAAKRIKSEDESDSAENVLAEDVQKSGPRGIILSIVGVSCFLGFVIFLFFIRRCLKDRQGETYKTDELCTDEGASLHDPELEAHKKKEYFM